MGIAAFTALMTAKVEASERLVTGIYTVLFPLTWAYALTRSVPFSMVPMSRRKTVVPDTGRIGVPSSSAAYVGPRWKWKSPLGSRARTRTLAVLPTGPAEADGERQVDQTDEPEERGGDEESCEHQRCG